MLSHINNDSICGDRDRYRSQVQCQIRKHKEELGKE